MKKGIDISHHQGYIDFAKVKESGLVDFVIIREGYRALRDNKFVDNVNGCRENDIPILAAYHFIYATTPEEAIAEAESCISGLSYVGLDKEDIIVIADFEYDSVDKARDQLGVIITKEDCNKITVAFCEYIERQGYKTGIYTNLDYYKNWYTQETLRRWPIWLADYKGDPDYTCMIQQYSSAGTIPGITGPVDLDYYFDGILAKDENFKMNENSLRLRDEMVFLAKSWMGKNEADGSFKEIIDIYNSYAGKNVTMQYDWAWCCCFWSALAIKLGYADMIPIEISCGRIVEEAKRMEIWQEDDHYIPKPGDAILYDWQASGTGDHIGWPDHIGIVEIVQNGYIYVIEGNKNDAVGRRIVSNTNYIRGFITPKYDETDGLESGKPATTIADEVIKGMWNKGEKRKALLEHFGYNYREVQDHVNAKKKGETIIEETTEIEGPYFSEFCGFGEALIALKGNIGAIRRRNWADNVLIQKGCTYEGQYFSIQKEDGNHEIWSPTPSDCFAEDWEILEVLQGA